MARALAIFTGGVIELRQAAIREDGTVFTRSQGRHPRYGYSWTPWRATGEVLGANAIAGRSEIQCGFATLRRASPHDSFINNRALFDARGKVRVRLPS